MTYVLQDYLIITFEKVTTLLKFYHTIDLLNIKVLRWFPTVVVVGDVLLPKGLGHTKYMQRLTNQHLTTSYSSNSCIHSTNSVPLNTKQWNYHKLMKRPIVLIF